MKADLLNGQQLCEALGVGPNHALAMLVGREIPGGMVIDHNCRNTSCCNPAHLDVVTPKRNSELRPEALSQFCKRGHEYTPENTLRKHGRRNCRECRKVHQRGWRERHRGQKPQEAAR